MADLASVIREECNPPMLTGDMSYHDITDQIASITEWKKTPRIWWVLISFTGTLLLLLLCMLTYLVSTGHRRLGKQQSRRMGMGHHKLRVVDRYRPRRHVDLGHFVPAAAKVENRHQPRCRGDDDFRRGLRRYLPACSIPAAPGAQCTGCSRFPTRICTCGRTTGVPSIGTCLRSAPMERSRFSSGSPG